MRESQKQILDSQLHQTILSRIIVIQRWYRTIYQRRHFVVFKAAVIRIQVGRALWIRFQTAGFNNLNQREFSSKVISDLQNWYYKLPLPSLRNCSTLNVSWRCVSELRGYMQLIHLTNKIGVKYKIYICVWSYQTHRLNNEVKVLRPIGLEWKMRYRYMSDYTKPINLVVRWKCSDIIKNMSNVM